MKIKERKGLLQVRVNNKILIIMRQNRSVDQRGKKKNTTNTHERK